MNLPFQKKNIFLNVMKDEVIRDALIKSDYIKEQIITNQNLVQHVDDFSPEKYEKSQKKKQKAQRKIDEKEQKTEVGIYEHLYQMFILIMNHLEEYNVIDTASFWDEPVTINKAIVTTAAVFALAKGNHDIVEWLEEQGAVSHKG
eukprot:50233_1